MTDENLKDLNTCKNCGNIYSGRYCNICGEKIYSKKDKKIFNLLEEATHFITHFDGTLFNTLRALFTAPGKLSEDYCNGIRKKYFKPVSFFLLLVVIYLLFPLFEGLNQRLFYHMHSPFYGDYATKKIIQLQKEYGLSMDQISNVFHNKGEKVSKFLLFILLPFSAMLFNLLLFKRRRLFFDHFIFATEVNIVFLLWGFLLLPLVLIILEFFFKILLGKNLPIVDLATGLIIYVGVAFYTALAAKRFYSLKYWQSIVLAIVFLILYFLFIMFIYKFILFMLVFWQIS